MTGLPLFLRKFLIDFLETGLAAVFALTFTIPGSLEDGKAVALLFASAIAGAAIAAARRALPGLYAYVRDVLAVPPDEG